MNTDLRCAICGRIRPSVYYFATPGLCVDCVKQPAHDVSQPLTQRASAVDQSPAVNASLGTPRLAWYVFAAALGAVWGLSSHSESREAFSYDVTLNGLASVLLVAVAFWWCPKDSPAGVVLRCIACGALIVAFFRLFALR